MSDEKVTLDTAEWVPPPARDFSHVVIPNYKPDPNHVTGGTVSVGSRSNVRVFETGATRDTDEDKYDYEAFLSPIVILRYGEYMHKNRFQKDGNVRDGDNWQRGIDLKAYIKSMWRHFLDFWLWHRGYKGKESLEDTICAIIFNASGYLFEILKNKEEK